MNLDLSYISFSAMAHRLIEVALANMNFVNLLALVGAALYVLTQLVRTIVPLRVLAILSNIFFIAYGASAGVMTTFLLYLLALPINMIRLHQMLDLVKQARTSSRTDLSMHWLRPFMSPRKYRKGEVLFHKGDVAREMLLAVTGRFLVVEIGIEIAPGCLFGELGFVAAENRRTQTVSCIEDANVLTISYDKLLELHFHNAEFSYYFLRLATERLIQDIRRLEQVAEAKAAIGATKADAVIPK